VILGRGFGLINEWGLASNILQQAIQVDSRNSEAWAWLGEARQHLGFDGGVELDKALTLDSNDPIVHALRGLYWKRKGNYSNMQEEYLQAAKIEPDNPAWQASMGDTYSANGDLISAFTSYQAATLLAPDNATYWQLLAIFCADNSVHVLEVGLPAAKKAVELAPHDPHSLDALGWSYAQSGLLYNAQQTLLEAIQTNPEFALAHLHLGETYLRKGDDAAALNELKLARQLDENGPTGQFAAQLLKQYFP
jgi:tetratricopeptide (TPR) repeat protein